MSQSPIQLLLIEDNPADVRMFAEIMKDVPSNPIQVTSVPTMAAAITTILKKPLDVIVADLHLSDSQGLDTVRTLYKLINVPIIVLSSQDQHSLIFQSLEQGAYDYFIKGELNGRWVFHVLMRAFYEKGRHVHQDVTISRNKFLIDQASDDLSRAIGNLNRIQSTLSEIEKGLAVPLRKMEKVDEKIDQLSQHADEVKAKLESVATTGQASQSTAKTPQSPPAH